MVKYIKVNPDGMISGETSQPSEGFIPFETDDLSGLVDPNRPYYLIDGEITQPELVLTYAERRKLEYLSWEDQLDDIYHNGVDAWKSSIKTIKDKYPKP